MPGTDYNNAAAVPHSAALIADWQGRSAAMRSGRGAHLDLPYGPGERQCWDIYPGVPDAPCLVFIHGGYWQKYDRQTFAFVTEGLRSRGWSAALPGYTLAPAASLGAIVAEIGLALDWFSAERRSYGIAGPVLLAGWSAGATLAMLHAGHPMCNAVLLISGIYELAPLRQTPINDALALSDRDIETCSALRHACPRGGLIAVGSRELPALRWQSEAMAAHVRAGTGDWAFRSLAAADHYSILEALADPQADLATAAQAIMR